MSTYNHHSKICNNPLTQKQIIHELIRTSKKEMVGGVGLSADKDDNISPNMWFVDISVPVSFEDAWYRLFAYYGGTQTAWEYTWPHSKYKCILNSITGPAFPVTSLGISLHLKCLNAAAFQAEEIYLVTDSLEAEYDKSNMSDIGWKDLGDNRFEFSIPANNTRKERFWSVKLYYKNIQDWQRKWEDAKRMYDKDRTGMKWPIVTLNFIQVTDTFHPDRTFGRDSATEISGHGIYTKYIPFKLDPIQ